MTRTDSYSHLVGYRVANYVIDELVDTGGQAVVYSAHHPQYPKRKYALKIFGLTESGPRSLEVGRREAEKLAVIEHPSVVRFYVPDLDEVDFEGEPRQVLCLPMDFADLGNCDKSPPFKNQHLSIWNLRALIGVLDGLQEIHRNELVHEDIKPANILQFEERHDDDPHIVLRITDFGIAKVRSAVLGVGPTDPTGMTVEFMCPEQLDHRHDSRGDIYSMGATFYYLITGELPISPPVDRATDPHSQLLAWQIQHKSEPRPNAAAHSIYCPARLALLIFRMMSVDPEERPDLEQCKKEIRRIIDTRERAHLQRFELPKELRSEFELGQFPITYAPKDFDEVFKPKVHEVCGLQLFVIRIKMGHPVFSQYKVLIEYMVKRLSDCFYLYETWGTFDVNILLWAKDDNDQVKSLKRNLEERLAGSKVQIRPATKIHDLLCSNISLPDDANPVYALAVQEKIDLPGLDRDAYICRQLHDRLSDNAVRAFTYVESAEPTADPFIRNAIIRHVYAELSELVARDSKVPEPCFPRMSIIELTPQVDTAISGNDTSVMLVNFASSQYRFLSDIPTAIINAVGENAVKTATFLETRRVCVESDKIIDDDVVF